MSGKHALSPKEAAHIAANAYFTLQGWEKTYAFKMNPGSTGKEPKPKAGLAASDVISKNVTGSGPQSVAKAGLKNAKVTKAFQGSSGSNLGRVKSGYGYILQFERGGKKHLVFAVRGTRPEMSWKPDLITDLNVGFNRIMPNIGPVHTGFYDTFESLKPALNDARAEIEAADVVHCVGHSLGGAVANLVAIHLARKGANVRLYTFGAPRVGLAPMRYDKKIKTIIGEENIFRVSHNFDPIPMIPLLPYIHALPSSVDRNNFYIGGVPEKISIDNHDMNLYIKSMSNLNWDGLRAMKTQESFVSRQYFENWRSSDNWIKKIIGHTINACMAVLHRVLQGMANIVSLAASGVTSILDLLVLVTTKSAKMVSDAAGYIGKFLTDCAKVFRVGVKLSAKIMKKLLVKLSTELAVIARAAIKRAAKVAKSSEFRTILAGATAASMGMLFI